MFLGVDGGDSKTAFCLLTDDGLINATTDAASIYYFFDTIDTIDLVGRVLKQGIATVCADAGITPAAITYAFFACPATER